MTCVPTNALELVEVAAARDARRTPGGSRPAEPVEQPLDVLAQHAVTVALGGGFRAGELYDEVRTTCAYRELRRRRVGLGARLRHPRRRRAAGVPRVPPGRGAGRASTA